MDKELFPEPITYRSGLVTGRVTRLVAGYPRAIKVGQPALMTVLVTAGLARLVLLSIAAILTRKPHQRGGRRRWSELRKGPEFLVTPLRVRATDGALCEMEIHGHLPQSAIAPADHVQIRTLRQKDGELPPRVERIVNLTTGQLLTPRTPTIWSHLGPALLLQAMIGLLLVGTITACAIMFR